MNTNDVWYFLGRAYLKANEFNENLDEDKRKILIKLTKLSIFRDVWNRMKTNGETKYPFLSTYDSKFITEDRRIIVMENNEVKHSKLIVEDNKFVVMINQDIHEILKRTLLAHEIGHTFFYNTDSRTILPYFIRNRQTDFLRPTSTQYDADESIAYEIGRRLLLPSEPLKSLKLDFPSMYNFLEIIKLFRVSKEILAKRLFWDIEHSETPIDFRKNAALYIYPHNKITNNQFLPPKGSGEIYRGTILKEFQIQSFWTRILPLLKRSLLSYNEIINSKDFPLEDPNILYAGNNLSIEIKSLKSQTTLILITTVCERSPTT